MAGLHPLELLACIGALVTALLTVVRPVSRARLVAAWSLVGTAGAATLLVGWRAETVGLYAVAVLLLVAAWLTARRVAGSPRLTVWRAGRGGGSEHVAPPAGPLRWLVRLLLLVLAVVAASMTFGLIGSPWTL